VRLVRRETEIKLPLNNAEDGRALLEAAGFRAIRARVFESNIVLDNPEGHMRRNGVLLRVREAGGAATLTYKGPSVAARHKIREEIEVAVSSAAELRELFQRLGYSPAWRYEKFRTEFQRDGAEGHVCLDETPIGAFLELEGAPEWIDATARQLGFSERDYIVHSYAALYFARRREAGLEPGDMVFHQDTTSKSQPNPGLSEGLV
jgi:adenylate cyclase class 2